MKSPRVTMRRGKTIFKSSFGKRVCSWSDRLCGLLFPSLIANWNKQQEAAKSKPSGFAIKKKKKTTKLPRIQSLVWRKFSAWSSAVFAICCSNRSNIDPTLNLIFNCPMKTEEKSCCFFLHNVAHSCMCPCLCGYCCAEFLPKLCRLRRKSVDVFE